MRHLLSPLGRRRLAQCLIALLVCLSLVGCLRRRMTICSNPPGALVYVDDYPIGATPVSHNFTYYGKRKIRLVKDGYETLTTMQTIRAPWYQIPPLDFFSENLTPGEIRDERMLSYQMVPQKVVPTEELLQRAEGLRHGVRPVGVAPTAPAFSPGGVRPPSTAPPYNPPPFTPNPNAAAPGPTLAPPGPMPAAPDVGGQPLYPLPPSGRP